jgi:hypothetical protein
MQGASPIFAAMMSMKSSESPAVSTSTWKTPRLLRARHHLIERLKQRETGINSKRTQVSSGASAGQLSQRDPPPARPKS